ncbi:MAG TPA: nucleoside-diphosphate kinase [Verrucomicrobiota bacterium]|jgi:nucleoside-diphosphate kinase|nr:nucleoside-diphosphate kinase [Verrucomicrobiota bacterium]|tara:strand:- start:125 stop:556 length:432 start_codon:yes stop_codon:yes gene_type:complete
MIRALMEESLVLLKPDCLEGRKCGEVLKRFEEASFEVFGVKMMRLSDEILREHYAHLTDLPFFPEIQGFMQSSPVVAIALRGENAIVRIRNMVGPTDSTIADKGTIRGDFGKDKMRNVVHASDSVENGQAELKRFFTESELFG